MKIIDLSKNTILLLGLIIFFISSCGDDGMEEMTETDPCESIEFTGSNLDFNGETYKISEYSYSDFILFNHNFKFKAFDDNCLDSLEINLDFGNQNSSTNFILAGEYLTKFVVNNVLLFDHGEMGGYFEKSGESLQYILSGGSAIVEKLDGSSYQITVDAPTSSLTGGVTNVMQLSVIVDVSL